MHPIIYDVAVSIDGYISGPNGDVSGFAHEGAVVDDYRARLAGYSCAIMGRATYEFGYQFGMAAGQNPYVPMRCVVISSSLSLPVSSEVEACSHLTRQHIDALKSEVDGPIYLCGGGTLAASLLEMGAIDRLRLKRAPILLGGGTPLFAQGQGAALCLEGETTYSDGYVFQDYSVLS